VSADALPPFASLRQVARRIDQAGIRWALGGSALLFALGLARHVGDLDLTTDATADAIQVALLDLAPVLHGNSGIHADHKLVCFSGQVEVIARFAFFGPRGVIHIPTDVTGEWRGLPLGSPEAWAVAYTLLVEEAPARAAKAEALFGYLARHGDSDRLLALSKLPLPDALRDRLRDLATARDLRERR